MAGSKFSFKIEQYFNFKNTFFTLKHILYRTKPTYSFSNSFSKLGENDLLLKIINDHEINLILIDKDNTLTLPYSEIIDYNSSIALSKLQKAIGFKKVMLFSNSIGSSDDTNKEEIPITEKRMNIKIFVHNSKKPRINLKNLESVTNKAIERNKVLIIGDRLFTDVYMAHEYGFISLLVKPINYKKDNIMVRFVRNIENILI